MQNQQGQSCVSPVLLGCSPLRWMWCWWMGNKIKIKKCLLFFPQHCDSSNKYALIPTGEAMATINIL